MIEVVKCQVILCVAENIRSKPATAGHPPRGAFPAYTCLLRKRLPKFILASNNQLKVPPDGILNLKPAHQKQETKVGGRKCNRTKTSPHQHDDGDPVLASRGWSYPRATFAFVFY